MRPCWCGVVMLAAGLALPAALTAQGRGNRWNAKRDRPIPVTVDSSEAPLSKTNEDGQPSKLPALLPGMTLDLIRGGDDLFHGKGHCFACHGADAEGMPNAGSAITLSLNFIPIEWHAIDSLIIAGIPEAITRSAIAMPPRGGKSDLTNQETRAVAAYVWAISQVRGEPWPGGHRTHQSQLPSATP